MINEFIEKEIEKLTKDIWKSNDDKISWFPYGGDDYDFNEDNAKKFIRISLQTIAKEVAMRFEADLFYWSDKPHERMRKLAKEIINEVSK
jgi:hypothetical protein